MNTNTENLDPTLSEHMIETSSTTITKTIEQPHQQQREPTKKYKFKSKTDFIGGKVSTTGGGVGGDEVVIGDVTSNENELVVETNENSRPGGGLSLTSTGEPTSVAGLEIGMTIQERMAALKKIGEDSWKRRTPADSQPPAPINIESTQPNIVKQQKEQIQLQLKQMLSTTKTKSLMGVSPSVGGGASQRNVLSTLDDNNADNDVIVGVVDINKTASITATATRDQDLFASKKALIEKRVLFTPPDLAAQHGN